MKKRRSNSSNISSGLCSLLLNLKNMSLIFVLLAIQTAGANDKKTETFGCLNGPGLHCGTRVSDSDRPFNMRGTSAQCVKGPTGDVTCYKPY